MSSHSDGPKGSKKPRRNLPRKPPNAHVPRYETLSDIVEAVGAELRKLPLPDGETIMSRKERVYRLMIERALREGSAKGSVRDLVHLLRLMVKYPNIAVGREEWHYFISRGLWP